MQWGAPQGLLLLWAVPAAGLLLHALMRMREYRLRTVMDEQVLNALLPARRRQRLLVRLGLWLVAITLCVIALARPQWGEKWIEVQHMGLDIVVALDTSNSMLAEDIRPNRLERAKLGVRDLVNHLRGDRIGLIPFAGDSYLYCPLTADYGAFLMMLDDVHAGIIPRGGTAIEQALRQAVQSFDEQVQADRVIILVTDGEDHEGQPLNVLNEMRRRHIRLFAVGVGTPEGTLIPITDERGRTTYLRDREGNIVRTPLQEDVLERLATRTGGIYVRATPGDFGLDHIYEQGIAPLQRDLLETETIRTYEERYMWFLGMAMVLLMVEAMVSDGSSKQKNRRLRLFSSAGAAAAIFIVFSFPARADAPRALMRRGLRDYEEDRFMEAAEAFQEAAEQAPDLRLDPARALYNRANALHQQGRYEEAANTYLQALRTTDPDLQHAAHFNRGNTLLARAAELAEEQQPGGAKNFVDKALESYRHTLLLRPDDREAKINHEWADRFREQLEELIAQQPPEPEPQPGDDDPETDEPDETPQPAPDEPGDDESEESPPQPDEPDAPAEAESAPQEWMPDTMEEMTEEEAMVLLDAMRDEEQQTRDQMRLRLGDPAEVEKDW